MAQLAIIGTGYVGLTTGVCFAHLGHNVVCADVDAEKVERLRNGDAGIVEHRLPELLNEGLSSGRLSFVVGAAEAVPTADVVFLCVPTPQGDDGSADLSYVEKASAEIASALPYECIVVNKSTVPVGSTRVVERVLQRPDVRVVSNPEFLREGSAVDDFLRPDRVVVGAEDSSAAHEVAALYESVRAQVVVTDPASAEMIKYAANAFLATKLSFVNAIANICELVGADVTDVVLGMGFDKRIGHEFLRPGPGWGGSCFPKDSRALVNLADKAGYQFGLLESVIHANDEQFDHVVAKIRHAAGGELNGARIAAWGLTFKARTDDLRESPALTVLQRVLAAGATVVAHDPTVDEPRVGIPDGLVLAPSALAAVDGADALAVLTEWDEYRWVDPVHVAERMTGKAVVDGRNLLDRPQWEAAGFLVHGIGR